MANCAYCESPADFIWLANARHLCTNCIKSGYTDKTGGKVMEQKSISWGELAELTHATQVEQFGFCTCEEQNQLPYDDCPKEVI